VSHGFAKPRVNQGEAGSTPWLVTGTFTPSGTQDVNLTQIAGAAVTLGQKAMAASIPVVIASNQSAIPASQSGTWTVTGAGGTFPVTDSAGSLTVDAPVGTPVFVRLSDGSAAISTLPVSLASVPTHAVTQSGSWSFSRTAASAATLSNVANSATSVSVLASNASRRGALFFNDDTASTGATVKLKLGATASATSFTIAIAPQGYYELPDPVYTGAIDAIATAATGTLRVTELT